MFKLFVVLVAGGLQLTGWAEAQGPGARGGNPAVVSTGESRCGSMHQEQPKSL